MFKEDEQIYIFGTTLISSIVFKFLILSGYRVKGYICDFKNGASFQGEWVYSRDDLEEQNKQFTVVNCSLTSFREIREYYEKNKLSRYVNFYELGRHFPVLLDKIDFFQNMKELIQNDEETYIEFSYKLSDERSRTDWLSVLQARKNFSFDKIDIDYDKNQYFPDFISLSNDEVYVDAGANAGDTVVDFINKTAGEFKKIHIFEPQETFLNRCRERFISHENIEYHQKVVSEKPGIVKFLDDFGSGSKISTSGHDYVSVSIDEAIKDRITFLKIDVEGEEMGVLNGAKKTIIDSKPKIAVCVYHNQKHFVEVPEFLLALRPDYKVYFRHHSPGIFESVMYFI